MMPLLQASPDIAAASHEKLIQSSAHSKASRIRRPSFAPALGKDSRLPLIRTKKDLLGARALA